ncbi:FepA family TonB-dependent siderophore receptor [Neisseria sp. Ec49-e6-T10]|uniref:FepA family TonB-dependent siderophore receptor n=1 Tax=Neisseria sp. Ec49-e6-T10 TaxID=3140744 RepID=UPI003EBF2340
MKESKSHRFTDTKRIKHKTLAVSIMMLFMGYHNQAIVYGAPIDEVDDIGVIRVTAEEELKQSLGVSVITSEDIEKRPPANDLSELIRTMPGVNLTGNSATGQRGNNRQIDIRGMGPENTLIMIDGKPVSSRNSIRYGWRGERDTRGDSNWVPVEEVEKIEVIRGPAAARYGSNAAGGVVNIITKKTSDQFKGSISWHITQPEDSDEGATQRGVFHLSGPMVKDKLGFRLYGSFNKTDADSPDINAKYAPADTTAAGREGVENKDVNGLLRWQITPDHQVDLEAGFSRQGNIYTGDSQNSNSSALTESLAQAGRETNRMYRENFALSYNGTWGFGTSKLIMQYDRTKNSRMKEGLAGGPEGQITDEKFYDNLLKNYRINGEANTDFALGATDHVVTVGAEWNKQELQDSASLAQALAAGDFIAGVADPADRDPNTDYTLWGVYVEDNITLPTKTTIIPGIRFDHDSRLGSNWTPSLNIFQHLGPYFTIKGGIARAFKTPNLYQSNANYLLFTRGNGCSLQVGSTGSCYLLGNSDLKAETSVNKELGIQFEKDEWAASIAWFRNDYKNKIVAGIEAIEVTNKGNYVFQWRNAKKAVVEGLEGNITIPILSNLKWISNFTYMIESKDKETNDPLSIIPEYTVNSSLDWQVNDKFSTMLTLTNYGRQKPREHANSRIENKEGGMPQDEVGSYSLVGISAGYTFDKYFKVRAGISNLFDKQLYRTSQGAQSYNEPGRAYYLTATLSF